MQTVNVNIQSVPIRAGSTPLYCMLAVETKNTSPVIGILSKWVKIHLLASCICILIVGFSILLLKALTVFYCLLFQNYLAVFDVLLQQSQRVFRGLYGQYNCDLLTQRYNGKRVILNSDKVFYLKTKSHTDFSIHVLFPH